jgi:hypothetical protein
VIRDVKAAFVESHKGGRHFFRGRKAGQFLLSVEPKWIFLRMHGEPNGEDLVSIFSEASNEGLLRGTFFMLIDMTTFIGGVDWREVTMMRNLIDWRELTLNNVAYVVRDMEFAMIVKVASVIFPGSHHKAFLDQAEAMDWLCSPPLGDDRPST